MNDGSIELEVEVRQVKSMADMTWNITLNAPEYCLEQVQEIMAHLLDMAKVTIAFE